MTIITNDDGDARNLLSVDIPFHLGLQRHQVSSFACDDDNDDDGGGDGVVVDDDSNLLPQEFRFTSLGLKLILHKTLALQENDDDGDDKDDEYDNDDDARDSIMLKANLNQTASLHDNPYDDDEDDARDPQSVRVSSTSSKLKVKKSLCNRKMLWF